MKEIKSFAELRTRAQELISTLKQLENEPKAADTIKKLFSDENSVCLSSLEEAIEAIEEGTQLVEAAEGDLRALRSHVERLIGQTDEVAVMREVASILRALQPLLTKISPAHPANPTLCAASTDSSFDYLRRLALILHELSEDSEEHRAMLESSASTVSAVTVFLNQLRSELRQVQNLCHPDRQSSVSSIRALANIIANLADMTAVVGNHRTAEDIRKANLVTEKIMSQIQNMKDLKFGYNSCAENQDLASAADNMDDLANIIQDIGMDNFKEQLGINMDFDFEL